MKCETPGVSRYKEFETPKVYILSCIDDFKISNSVKDRTFKSESLLGRRLFKLFPANTSSMKLLSEEVYRNMLSNLFFQVCQIILELIGNT